MEAIKRVEVIGNCTLYLGDCGEILPTLGRVDAVVTDPPYGLGDKWQGGKANTKARWKLNDGGANMGWDASVSTNKVSLAIGMASHAIIWGGNYYDLPPVRGWLIWDKIVREFTSGHVEMAWTTLDQPTRAFNFSHGALASEGKQHPTQKPVALMQWCLGFLPKAETVLDPFMGSGTTGVACARMGRSFIGIELHEPYFEVACERIEGAYRQGDIFLQAEGEPKGVQTSIFGEDAA